VCVRIFRENNMHRENCPLHELHKFLPDLCNSCKPKHVNTHKFILEPKSHVCISKYSRFEEYFILIEKQIENKNQVYSRAGYIYTYTVGEGKLSKMYMKWALATFYYAHITIRLVKYSQPYAMNSRIVSASVTLRVIPLQVRLTSRLSFEFTLAAML